ncbi:MAG: signal peptidase I [Acholeplasmataceae bacterium]
MKTKEQSKFKKAMSIVLNVIFYVVIVFLLVFSFANMKVKREDNIANIFNQGMLAVQSNSMYGDLEDSFQKGDLLFVTMLDDESRALLQVGDVVTYFDTTIHEFNTHRIVEINAAEGYLITQADYNYISNNNNTSPDQPVNIEDVLAIYHGDKLVGFGNALDYLQTPTGFAVFIILPVVLLLAFEGVMLARNLIGINKDKLEEKFAIEKENAKLSLEAEKEKMRAEILKELENEKNKS